MANLVYEIRSALELPSKVSNKVRNLALREIIDGYVSSVERAKKHGVISQCEYEKIYCPLLNSVIKGETTFNREYEKLGPQLLMQQGATAIFAGNVDLETQVKDLDRAVYLAYTKESNPGTGPGLAYPNPFN